MDFSSATAERNSTKLNRKLDLNVLYQVCVFRGDWKNKMAALASDWLRHFGLLLWNRWTEINETWQETRSQRPLPSLCVSGRLEKQDGRPGLWLAETFWTSPLKPLNGIQRNLTGSKILMSFYQVCVFRADRKKKMATLANQPKRWHIVLRCTICGPLGLLLCKISKVNKSDRSDYQNIPFSWKSIFKDLTSGWQTEYATRHTMKKVWTFFYSFI